MNRLKKLEKLLPVKILGSIYILLALSFQISAQTYPPSCVITAPYTNAYFKENSDVVIKVYSTDIGKTTNNGTVTSVKFYNGNTLLGEATTHTDNTYTLVWGCVPRGTYTITAVATNNRGVEFTSAGVEITVGTANVTPRGMSSCKGKYLANIIAGSVNSDYNTYWNGVTAENSCKWGSVEGTRNQMNWGQADISYNHAKNNNLMFRYHAIAWGSQYPNWITNLSVTDFRREIDEYMAAIAARYEYIDQIDVLNENLKYLGSYNNGQEHAAGTPYFRAGMGGAGTTGYDWAIWLFERARHHFPNSKLVMNDFELENNTDGINYMVNMIKVLRDRGLIDGFGTQAHTFNVDQLQNSPNTLRSNLDLMATSGLPVYVTELDLTGSGSGSGSEQAQLTSYQNLFPVYWNHPAVAGITIWGYVEGATWRTGTGLLNSNRTERAAMRWLKEYVGGLDDVGYPLCNTTGCTPSGMPTVNITSPTATSSFTSPADVEIQVAANDSDGQVTMVQFYNGTTLIGQSTTAPFSYTWNNVQAGSYTIHAVVTDNEDNTATSGSVTFQVSGPPMNGPIEVRARGFVGDEIIELEIDGEIIETWTLTTTDATYSATGNVNGVIRINYTNDDGEDRDAFIDYINVAGVIYEAEDQAINTGYYANGACGGGGFSETMHCDGYIQFETEPVASIDLCPDDPNKTEPGECGCGVPEGTCSPVNEVIILNAGWNIIGCPIEGSTPIQTALSSIWDKVIIVKDMGENYLMENPPALNSLSELKWGHGYLVKVSEECELEW